ncbi:hypothetical protein COOONC_00759 [Cooperia oncophora]
MIDVQCLIMYRKSVLSFSGSWLTGVLSRSFCCAGKKQFIECTVVDVRPLRSQMATELIADFVSGAILGASISTIFFPINVVKNHMQSKVGVAFENPFSVFCKVWQERQKSLRMLYLGVHLNFTRSLLAWGITNTVYELLRRSLKPY